MNVTGWSSSRGSRGARQCRSSPGTSP
uniref:Uncharacterized protein n=1 Tax=Arundo donax TaxID=35708 RepID=A0A0A8YC27_ARUDO